jgi:hypothetical protein
VNGLTFLAFAVGAAAVTAVVLALYWRLGDTMTRSQRREQRTHDALRRASRKGNISGGAGPSPTLPVNVDRPPLTHHPDGAHDLTADGRLSGDSGSEADSGGADPRY